MEASRKMMDLRLEVGVLHQNVHSLMESPEQWTTEDTLELLKLFEGIVEEYANISKETNRVLQTV